jgi:Ni/Co efflux regulator RcnB
MTATLKTLPLIIAVALSAAASLAHAQSDTKVDEAKTAPKVYHAGGPRHDAMAHEASARAKRNGAKLTEPKVHSGGRHNEENHKAAIRAESAGSRSAASAEEK